MEALAHTPSHQAEQEKKEGQLKAILYLLQTKLEEYSDDVDKSYELLKIGKKTNLTQELEHTIDDPFGSIAKMVGNIDENIKSIVETYVKSFLKFNLELVDRVFRSPITGNNLYYSIVLKEDNFENRNSIFQFFDFYGSHEISNKYPVYFQFTPVELIEKVKVKEEIILA